MAVGFGQTVGDLKKAIEALTCTDPRTPTRTHAPRRDEWMDGRTDV